MSIKIEDWEVVGWRHAIKGMRNALESWDKSDSMFYDHIDFEKQEIHYHDILRQHYGSSDLVHSPDQNLNVLLSTASYFNHPFSLGEHDLDLMMRLNKGGPSESKYRRFIQCYVDIMAPLFFLKQLDTYRHGVEKLSCSTMHRLHTRDLTLDDFSHEHLISCDEVGELMDEDENYDEDACLFYSDLNPDENAPELPIESNTIIYPLDVLNITIKMINQCRKTYMEQREKRYWWQLIELLPDAYNQRRTYMFSYEALAKIYKERKDHRLDEWRELCAWIETLPYSEIITGVAPNISMKAEE